jgi:hypothetical protein
MISTAQGWRDWPIANAALQALKAGTIRGAGVLHI